MLTILIFVLVLGVLVFVHELGHFMVARMNGIKADEFGFGFPPRLAGIVKDDATGRYRLVWGNVSVSSPHTVYSINWIPLGGFVKIKGEDRGSHLEERDSFAGRGAWTRIKVLGAGVVMNFLLAWVLFSIVLMLGFPEQIDPAHRNEYGKTDIQILQVQPGTPADEIGLKAGDLILSLDTTEVTSVESVSAYIRERRGTEITVTINRGEKGCSLSVRPGSRHRRAKAPSASASRKLRWSAIRGIRQFSSDLSRPM